LCVVALADTGRWPTLSRGDRFGANYAMLQAVSRIDDSLTGLSEAEAAARLAEDGPNELPGRDSRNTLAIIIEVLREPMLLMLLAACAVYLALGDFHEAVLIVGLATASILITVMQELRSERVLEALRDLTSPRALVIRGGERRRIPGRDVVRGDILVLSEGDRVPADAALMTTPQMEVDESLLTGESLPVLKPAPGDTSTPKLYSGTLIVSGNGLACVTAIGPRSEIGKIGKSLHSIEAEQPPLRNQIRRFVRVFAILAVVTSVVVAVLYAVLRGGWLEGVLGGLALSMALLPEEFPVVLTVFLVMGAWRISKVKVLTRRAAAIETLGSATVLCTDKTGTLTENRMAVAELTTGPLRWRAGSATAPSTPLHDLLTFSILASQPNPSDPMERAIHALGDELQRGGARRQGRLERLYPLSPALPAMTQVWTGLGQELTHGLGEAAEYIAAAKGAPETVARLCRLGEQESALMHEEAQRMASSGLRVLAVARAEWSAGDLPDAQTDFPFVYLGLIGLADPLKANVPAAVQECREAGIRVVMITGDYPATARAIAREAGIDDGVIITGADIETLGDAALATRVRGATVFARVRPDQKLQIVNALKANGEVVAMTGDGVNDAPSLKAAHIGVAMGGRGTDVAREASAIVLLDDDFASIVKTIRLGRRIYDNLQKAMTFVAAAHLPIAGLAFMPLLFGLPLMLLPVHIAFVEMIVDPVSSIAFEAEPAEKNIMQRPPRAIASRLLSGAVIKKSVIQGLAGLSMVAMFFLAANFSGRPEDEARSITFLSLVLANSALILSNRSLAGSFREAVGQNNPTLWVVLGFDALMLGALFTVPQIRGAFSFGPLAWQDVGLVIFAAAGLLAALSTINRALRRTA
jgi:Ca2+-transporting ATPase